MNKSSVLMADSLGTGTCCDVDHSQHEVFVEQTETWDKWGIILSSICAIHCLVTPILLLVLPALGTYFESPWVHLGLALFVVPVGLYAFWSGYQHHRKLPLLLLGCFGLLLVGGASLMPEMGVHAHAHSHSEIEEVLRADFITIAGSVLLLIGHFLNRRACLCHQH